MVERIFKKMGEEVMRVAFEEEEDILQRRQKGARRATPRKRRPQVMLGLQALRKGLHEDLTAILS